MRVAFEFNRITDIFKLAIAHNTLTHEWKLGLTQSPAAVDKCACSWSTSIFCTWAAALKTGTLLSPLATVQHSAHSHRMGTNRRRELWNSIQFFLETKNQRFDSISASPSNALARNSLTHSRRRARARSVDIYRLHETCVFHRRSNNSKSNATATRNGETEPRRVRESKGYRVREQNLFHLWKQRA